MKNRFRILFIACSSMLALDDALASDKLPEGNVPDAVELAVLEDIYTTMGGSSWTNHTNWPSSWPATATNTDYATWFGITVTGGDITAIVLPTNGLANSIPSSIGDLAELTYLDLSVNNISGGIPASIGNLSKLYYLSIAHNHLQSIPTEIGQATALRQVYLFVNEITSAFPASITNLDNLRELYLYQNQISGSLPSNIGDMDALENLWLDGNNMSGAIPASIGNLSTLRYLNLNNNHFSGSIPSSIGNLTNLYFLYLAANQLTGSIPAEIGSMTNVRDIFLHSNQLSGSIPSQMGNLSNLANLNLDYNEIGGPIPASFNNLTQLLQIRISQNNLSGPLPDLGNLDNLISLFLDNNEITGTIPTSLGGLQNLVFIGLGGNQLTGTIPTALGNLSHLADINLNSNKLTGPLPTSMASISSLAHFWVVGNKFTFSDILPFIALKPVVGYSQQDKCDVEKTINHEIGTTLHLEANVDRSTTPASSYIWYKMVGASYTPLNTESTSGHTVEITGLTAADEGTKYFYTIRNSSATDLGLSSNLWTLHLVHCDIPTISFETSAESYTYTFTPSVTGAESCSTSYLWDFGDGQTSPDATSSHVFNTTGTYVVRLTLTYQCGDCESSSVFVENTVEVNNTSICTAIYCDGFGGVGIGTMRTQGFRLSVDGKIRASDIIKVYPQGQWSDFVFEDKYRLRPLSEVEQFIKANGHLPEIPSAQEVEREGVELGSMDAKLLQKIEELTLYVIDLKKENETIKKELKRLKNEK